MPARQDVTFVIRARDATRGVFRRIGRGITGLRTKVIGFLGALGLAGAIKSMLSFATSIKFVSQNLGIGVRQMQALKLQAEDVNVPFESLTSTLNQLLANAGSVVNDESTDMLANFEKLGVSFKDLNELGADQILLKIADAAKKAGDDRGFRDALADVGGQGLVRLLPLLRQGGSAIAARTLQLIKEGATQGQKQLDLAAEEEARIRREFAAAQAEFRDGLIKVIPELRRLVESIGDLVIRIDEQGVGGVARDALISSGREAIPEFDDLLSRTVENQRAESPNLFLDDDAANSIIERAVARARSENAPTARSLRNGSPDRTEELRILREISDHTRESFARIGR